MKLWAVVTGRELAEGILAPIEACTLTDAIFAAIDTYPHLRGDIMWHLELLTPKLEEEYRNLPGVPK